MKKSLLSKLFVPLFVLMASLICTSCGDDETQNGWYVDLDTELSSGNFINNYFLQLAVSNELSKLNSDFMTAQLSESDAKNRFKSMCTQIKTDVDALGLPVLDDSYCVVYLTHSIASADSNYPVIATEKIYFTPSSK